MIEKPDSRLSSQEQREEEHFKRKQPLFEDLKDKIYYNADFISRETYKKIFDKLDLKGKTVLELGCGFIPLHEETYLREMDNRGANLIPVDKDSVRMSSWTLPPSQESREDETETIIQPVQTQIENLPFGPSSVDGCISINLLNEKSPEDIKVIAQHIYGVLKEEGFLLVSTFGYLRVSLEDGSVKYNDNFSADQIVSADQVKGILKEVGFSDLEDIPLDQERINKIVNLGAEHLLQDYFIESGSKPVSAEFIEPLAVLAKKRQF